MARIEERETKTGTSYRVVWYTKGKRQPPLTTRSKDKAEQWKRLIELHKGDQQAAARDLAKVKSQTPTLRDVALHHMERLRTERFTVQTYDSYLRTHIGPTLGSIPVDLITDDDVRRFIKKLESKLAVKTIHNICGFLSGVLSHAVKQGYIASSPYHHSMLPKAGPVEDHDKFMTRDEAQRIIKNIHSDLHRDIAGFLLSTGLRPAEMRALQVRDVNLEAQQPVVRVTKAMKQDRKTGDYIGPPKSPRSVRTVGLPPSTTGMLADHVKNREGSSPLFAGTDGQHLKREIVNWHWNQAVKRTPKLDRKPGLYALRHTHASLMLDAGMSIWELSRHMGHSSVSITERTYAHLMPDAHYKSAAFAAKALGEAEVAGQIEG